MANNTNTIDIVTNSTMILNVPVGVTFADNTDPAYSEGFTPTTLRIIPHPFVAGASAFTSTQSTFTDTVGFVWPQSITFSYGGIFSVQYIGTSVAGPFNVFKTNYINVVSGGSSNGLNADHLSPGSKLEVKNGRVTGVNGGKFDIIH